LPTGAETLDEPFNAFPSWFLRIKCDRCGKVQMVNQVHQRWDTLPVREILAKMRHDGCGIGLSRIGTRPPRLGIYLGGISVRPEGTRVIRIGYGRGLSGSNRV
jgi:hypothetical protein